MVGTMRRRKRSRKSESESERLVGEIHWWLMFRYR